MGEPFMAVVAVESWRPKTKISQGAQKKIHRTLVKGLLSIIILNCLSKKPMHGYGIMQEIEKTQSYRTGASTLYTRLAELEENGLVKSEWNMTAMRPKKVYGITAMGKNCLQISLKTIEAIQKCGQP